ncbi:hypothetical protein [Microlunatus sp. Y2014]|uniref:hypothetical protein n=1 Tax=Microlunatus sp. Y2014 TaxID=3418488 RepID=UPI003DA76F61
MAVLNDEVGLARGADPRVRSGLGRLVGVGHGLVKRIVVEPVAEGRLRDSGWPRGVTAVVTVCYALIGVAAVLVLFAGPLRARLTLIDTYRDGVIPQDLVWLLYGLSLVVMTLFLVACIHGRWWLTLIGVTTVVVWCLFSGILLAISGPLPALLLLVLIVLLIVLAVVWHRRPMRWWEFPVMLVVLGAIAVVAISGNQLSRALGFEPLAQQLAGTIQMFSILAYPTAFAGGAAAAGVTATVATRATGVVGRSMSARWVWVLLGLLVTGRVVQSVLTVRNLDPVRNTWANWLVTIGFLVAFTGVAWGIVRLARTPPDPDQVAEDAADLGLPVGVVVLAGAVPVMIGVIGITFLLALFPDLAGTGLSTDFVTTGDFVGVIRGLAAVVFGVVAVRLARRRRVIPALVLAESGVMLLATPLGVLTRPRFSGAPDFELLILLATVAALVLLVLLLVRRRLTPRRALTLSALLLLLVLFNHRTLLGEPLEELLGTAVGVLVWGIVWSLLTGSSGANNGNRTFPVVVRALSLMALTLLTVLVIAYNALARRPELGGLDLAAGLGDQVLGTAILVATAAGLVAGLRTVPGGADGAPDLTVGLGRAGDPDRTGGPGRAGDPDRPGGVDGAGGFRKPTGQSDGTGHPAAAWTPMPPPDRSV